MTRFVPKRQTTTQPLTNRIAKLIIRIGDPVIVRMNGLDAGIDPCEVYAALACKARIRRTTVKELDQLDRGV